MKRAKKGEKWQRGPGGPLSIGGLGFIYDWGPPKPTRFQSKPYKNRFWDFSIFPLFSIFTIEKIPDPKWRFNQIRLKKDTFFNQIIENLDCPFRIRFSTKRPSGKAGF